MISLSFCIIGLTFAQTQLAIQPDRHSPGFNITQFTEDHGVSLDPHNLTGFRNVRGIAVTPEGDVVAAASCYENVNMFEFSNNRFNYMDFMTSVTKSSFHSYAAERTGLVKIQAPNKDESIIATATIDRRSHVFATESGVWYSGPRYQRKNIFPTRENVVSLACGPHGAVAITTVQHLYLRENDSARFIPISNSANAGATAFDAKGRLWIGSNRGVDRWSHHRLIHVSDYPVPVSNVACAVVDRKGDVWFGTEAGVLRYDGSRWSQYGHKYLSDNHVLDIACGPGGAIWVASGNGVTRFERVSSKR